MHKVSHGKAAIISISQLETGGLAGDRLWRDCRISSGLSEVPAGSQEKS